MAKNKNKTSYYNNGSKAKTKKGVTGLIAAIVASAVVLGAAAGVMGYGTNGFTDWSFSNFSPKTEYANPIQPSAANGGAVVSDSANHGISLMSARVAVEDYEDYGIDPQAASNVYNLSVTYTPENTTFQQTTYSVAFKNPNSTWAKGKNVSEYATVSQSSAGSKDAVLTVLKPFSEQIIVTARSDRNSSLYAQTTVDYVCTTLNIDLVNSQVDVEGDFELTGASWSDGTVNPEMSGNIVVVFDLGTRFVNHMKSSGFTVSQTYEYVVRDSEEDIIIGDYGIGTILDFVRGAGNYNSLTTERKSAYQAALNDFYGRLMDGDYVGSYSFRYNRIYNGEDYGTGTIDKGKDIECRNFSSVFEIPGTKLTGNTSSIVAG